MRKKNVIELANAALETFRASIWGIVATYWFFVVFIGIFSYISVKVFGIHYQVYYQRSIYLGPTKTALSIFFYLVGFLFVVWQILVIKSNTLNGVNELANSFKKAIPKTLKVLPITLLLTALFTIILFPLMRIPQYGILIFQIASWLVSPFILMVFMGIILQDTPLKFTLKTAFATAWKHYFKIIARLLMLFLLYLLVVGPLGFIAFVFALTILGRAMFIIIGLISVIFAVIINCFTLSYFTEMYMDLAAEKEPEAEEFLIQGVLENTDISKVIMEKQKEDILKDMTPLSENFKETDGHYDDHYKETSTTEGFHLLGEDITPSVNNPEGNNTAGNDTSEENKK